jgi:prepilin-type N-terminal cleavage/methylation domain-containing protein
MLFEGRSPGFTLAELLVSLVILGVIATFTIPKVLNASTSSQTAIAKEAASMISGAFSVYNLSNTLATTTTPGVLQQYMNYASIDATTTYSTGMVTCSATVICLKLHSGAVLQYEVANTFGGTTTTDGIRFNLDPDGAGNQTAVTFVKFYNGRLTTHGAAGTYQTGGTALTPVATDPLYISSW